MNIKKYIYPYKINHFISIILISVFLSLFIFVSLKENYMKLVDNSNKHLSDKLILEESEVKIKSSQLSDQQKVLEDKTEEFQNLLKKEIATSSLDLKTNVKVKKGNSSFAEISFRIGSNLEFDYSIGYGEKLNYTELNPKGILISRYCYEQEYKDVEDLIIEIGQNNTISIPIKGIIETSSKSENIIQNYHMYMTLEDAEEYGVLEGNNAIYTSYLYEFKDNVEIKDYRTLSRYYSNILGKSKLKSEYMLSLMPLLNIIQILGFVCIAFFIVCLCILVIERGKHYLITEYVSKVYYQSDLKIACFFVIRAGVNLIPSCLISYIVSFFLFLILKSKIGEIYPNGFVFLFAVPMFIIIVATDFICYKFFMYKHFNFKN